MNPGIVVVIGWCLGMLWWACLDRRPGDPYRLDALAEAFARMAQIAEEQEETMVASIRQFALVWVGVQLGWTPKSDDDWLRAAWRLPEQRWFCITEAFDAWRHATALDRAHGEQA